MGGLRFHVVLSLVLCLFALLADGKNPGFKARLTSRGLNYANKVAIEALSKTVKQLKIPDISGSSGVIHYSVSGMAITSFTPPASTIALSPGKGLSWKATNAQISLHGNFHAKELFISESGSFDITVSSMQFYIRIDLGDDTHGRPLLTPSGCSCSLGNVDIELHGGSAWFLNLFKGKIADVIKSALQGQLCGIITNEISKDGNAKLASLPMTIALANTFLLDYGMTGQPEFTATYMETYHKGEIYWKADPKESPMICPAMKDSSAHQNMMYLWVSDYMFETIAYVAQKHNILVHNLTANDLPAASRGVLNTTCDGFIPKCVGRLIPAIGDRYPNSKVELHMISTQVPNMTVTSSGVSVKCAGQIDMYADTKGKQKPFLVTLYAKMSASVEISVANETIHGKIDQIDLKLAAGTSKIGPIDERALQFLIDSALKLFIEPQLNALGKKGFPLPITDEIKFINTNLAFDTDTIIIGTDLNYTPKLDSTPEHVKKTKQESGKLYFEPSLTNPAKASLRKKPNHL